MFGGDFLLNLVYHHKLRKRKFESAHAALKATVLAISKIEAKTDSLKRDIESES